MSEADEAYVAAIRMIVSARYARSTELDFNTEATHALDSLPPETSSLVSLRKLELANTRITDLSPIASLTELRSLGLSGTRVRHLDPLSNLKSLRTLELINTDVSDLSPISTMPALQLLDLTQSRISDLRALTNLSSLKSLGLSGTPISNIRPLSKLHSLETLQMNRTQVENLDPLGSLSRLRTLQLNSTAVKSLDALAPLKSLVTLWFADTSVAGISVLPQITSLRHLNISRTKIGDLRELLELPALRDHELRDLSFEGCLAAMEDRELAELSRIKVRTERTDKTIDYLASLPPLPHPLEVLANDETERSHEAVHRTVPKPQRPAPAPSPLRVAFIDGELRQVAVETGLSEDPAERERLARQALLDYLAEFDIAMRFRIENALPRLGKAMEAFETAIASENAFNPIAAGLQGERIRRLARNASERLMDDDGDDVEAFALQVGLYLERFLDWKAYVADATPETVPVEEIAKALPEFESVKGVLDASEWTARDVLQSYEFLYAEFRNAPEDALAAKGLDDATREITYTVVEQAYKEAQPLKKSGELAAFSSEVKKELRTGLAKDAARLIRGGMIAGGSASVLAVVYSNMATFISLAGRYPYVKDVLRFFGLL